MWFLNGIPPFYLSDVPMCFLPFAFRLCLVLTTAKPLGTTSRMFHFCKFPIPAGNKHITPPKKGHFWVDDFPFPQVGYVSSLEGVPADIETLVHCTMAYRPSSIWLSLSPSLFLFLFLHLSVSLYLQTHKHTICMYVYIYIIWYRHGCTVNMYICICICIF